MDMQSRISAGTRHPQIIDLSTARPNGEEFTVRGRYVRVAAASDAGAEIEIALENNVPSQYLPLRVTGNINEGQGFTKFYVKNTAQAGKWVKLIISEGKHDFDVDNASTDIIQAIIDDVPLDDAALLASINAITAMLQNDQDQRKGLTPIGAASYASQTGAGTNNVLTAVANTSGATIRSFTGYATSGSGVAQLVIGGNIISTAICSSNGVANVQGACRDLLVPAGVAIDLTNGGAGSFSGLDYEVL